MSKNKPIRTCYGCEYYYRVIDGKKNYDAKFMYKHCNKDHWKCNYFLGKSEVIK